MLKMGSILAVFCIFIIMSCVRGSFDMADNCRVFCTGPLLKAVQNAHIFHDSKDFVDMPLKYDPDTTLKAFDLLANKSDVETIRAFVQEFFLPPGAELQICHPGDWVSKPKTFDNIKDPNYRQWAYDLHAKWRTLCRRVKDDVKKNPNYYSLIPLDYPFIAPGGRFREFYYWDTYWIIKGLLASEMTTTAKNMIRNFGEMVKRYGFVPNGGRVYYLKRTQPPLLAGCVQEYFKYTGDVEFVREMLPLLEKEYQFWLRERSVEWQTPSGDSYRLFQYRVHQDEPRPESYKEDLLTADHVNNEEDKVKIWSNIASACETGWDFSSRWFAKDGDFKNNLRSVRTNRVIPVDLNAFMCWNQAILSDFYALLGNETASSEYKNEYKLTKFAINKAFWDEEDGSWYDLDMDTKQKSKYYYVSNPTPLFAKCAHDSTNVHRQVVKYLNDMKATHYPGGLPTSMVWSGEQWDSPNGWAPTNHMVIEGLRQSEDRVAQDMAFALANKWIQSNYFAFVRSGGKMFEKYNVERFRSAAGGGGEYEVQEGFGWTNGVILDLLLTYGDRLRAPAVPPIVVNDVVGSSNLT